MGQQNSLNCKNNSKDESRQIQTNQSNALLLMRSIQQHQEDSQLPSRKSTATRSDNSNLTPLRTSNVQKKNTPLVQHENILRVSNQQFRGAELVAGKWIELGGKSLAEIVESRYNSTMHFPRSQVVILIQSLVYALAYLEKAGIRHHDFYPTNVYYSSGIFKISNPALQETTAYGLTQQRQRFSFLSPELIAEIIQETPVSDIPTRIMFKADIFAIGMIVLEFCTLEQSSECYDQENYQLVDRTIQTRLAKVAKLYSPAIADCIGQMLRYDVEQRISPSELAMAVFFNAPSEKIEKEDIRNSQGRPGPPPKPNSPPIQYLQVPGQSLPPQPPVDRDNNVTMPAPNYVYSHIGPNNQSLLSGSALQNKLRVIQKIQQKPDEEDSEGLPSQLSQPSQMSEGTHMQRVIMGHPHLQSNQPMNREPSKSVSREPPQLQPISREPPQLQPISREPPQLQSISREPPQSQPISREPPQSQPISREQFIQMQQMQQMQQRQQLQPPPQRMEQRSVPQNNQGYMARQPPQGFPDQYPQGVVSSQPVPQIPYQQPMQGSLQQQPPFFPQVTRPPQIDSPPKPNSPPLAVRRNLLTPQTEQALVSGSIPLSGMNLSDKMLLSQPTYYQIHGKKEGETPPPPQNRFTPKILDEGNFEFNFTEKFGQGRTEMPSFKPTKQSSDFVTEHRYESLQTVPDSPSKYYPEANRFQNEINKYEMTSYQPTKEISNAVPSYHSESEKSLPFNRQAASRDTSFGSNKYSLSSKNVKYSIPSDSAASRPQKEESNQTLEQRVDRILQISRSIK